MSHVLSSRISSQPMGWSRTWAGNMENTLTQCKQASTAQYQKKRGLRLTSGDFDCDILTTLLGQEYSDGESGKPYFT